MDLAATSPSAPLRTAILISGAGSNMAAIIRASQTEPDYPAQIALVISNTASAGGLRVAEALGVKALCVPHTDYESREAFEEAIDAVLRAHRIELVCCAGFMRVLTGLFTSRWEGQIINIHPSLLPKHKGLNTHRRAIEAGDSYHGASVHFVTEALDAGHVIARTRVRVDPSDTPETLAQKVLAREHGLYIRALRKVAKALQSPK